MTHRTTLVMTASPRRGNCEAIARSLAASITESAAPDSLLLLRKHHVEPCVGCGACAGTGACVFDRQDQTRQVLHRIQTASALIVAAPVYFYGPPAQFKALIDRSQAIWEANGCRPAPGARRPAYVVLTAARKAGERLFDASLLILRCFFDVMGFQLQDSLLLRGLDGPEDFARSESAQDTLARWSIFSSENAPDSRPMQHTKNPQH